MNYSHLKKIYSSHLNINAKVQFYYTFLLLRGVGIFLFCIYEKEFTFICLIIKSNTYRLAEGGSKDVYIF